MIKDQDHSHAQKCIHISISGVLKPHLIGQSLSFLSRGGISRKGNKRPLNSLLCSFCKGNYKLVQIKLSLSAAVSAIQITGEQFSEKWAGSYFHQNNILLICLPKSQNYLLSLLKNNLQKISKTLMYLKGSGEFVEEIIFTGAGLKRKNTPINDLAEI